VFREERNGGQSVTRPGGLHKAAAVEKGGIKGGGGGGGELTICGAPVTSGTIPHYEAHGFALERRSVKEPRLFTCRSPYFPRRAAQRRRKGRTGQRSRSEGLEKGLLSGEEKEPFSDTCPKRGT